jgi:PAS domain S-box-containing protein
MASFTKRIQTLLFPRHSILATLMFVLMVTVTMALILTGLLLTWSERAVFRNLSAQSISTLAGVIGSNSTAALAFMDKKVADEILGGLASEPEIELGCLYDKSNQLLSSYQTKNPDQPCPIQVPEEGEKFADGKLSFEKKIWHENDFYGSIYLLSNMRNYHRQMQTSIVLLITILIISAILAYTLAQRLQKLVTGPILKLTETTRSISEEGRYSLRAEKSSEIEVNALVTSFNRMLDVIQEREASIRQNEEQFRAAFELAAVGNVLTSPEGRFIRVNSEVCRMLEYSKEELLECTFSDVTYPEDRQVSQFYSQSIYQGELASTVFEKRYVTKSGSILWALVSAAPILDASGRATSIIGVIQNITERKRAEQERDRLLAKERDARLEAEKSVQARDEFLSIASHELRTPLTPIKMHLEMMRMMLQKMTPDIFPQAAELLQAFDISERQVKNLESLIQDLLDVSRITAGRIVLHRQTVHLQDVITNVMDRMQADIQKSHSSIELNFEARPIGFWDPMRIEQIFSNLLTNALKYGNGQNIQISVSEKNQQAILTVQDHGIGIANENQKRIFERFERVASIRHYDGLGLGLYITRELVNAHGGHIRVESEVGRGSTFSVELPAIQQFLPQ